MIAYDLNFLYTAVGLGVSILISIIFLIINILFILSLCKTLALIPEDKYTFPRWFCWMMLIPVVGFVFMWMMLPFGIPSAIKENEPDNQQAVTAANGIFGLGLAYVVMLTVSLFIPLLFIFLGIGIFVVWIIYWVKVVKVRQYINSPTSSD